MLNQPSIAERIAYGRPLEPSDEPRIYVAPRPLTALLGRAGLALLFFMTGFGKLTNIDGTAGTMTSVGIPDAKTFAVIAGIAEVAGAASLLFGFLTRLGALGLILFLIPTTLIFHAFWHDAVDHQQLTQFLKNIGIMGGLAAFVAYGAGRYSLDAAMRRPVHP